MGDNYDEAVAHLTQHPELIFRAWSRPFDTTGGCLFSPVAPESAGHNLSPRREDGTVCGCLTQIVSNMRHDDRRAAWTDELTAAIRADNRIPPDPSLITAADLPVFAEWQRKIDLELGRAD